MRLHRFYISQKIDSKKFDISDKDLVHQWKKVFRYNVGSQVIIFDGSNIDFLCVITSIRNLGATLEVIGSKETAKPKNNIFLCVSLLKKDNFELVVQKTVEIGVSTIIPVIFERSEKKKINKERLQKIAKEASEQSGRGDLANIGDVYEIEDLLSSGILPQEKIFFDKNKPPIKNYLQSNTEQHSFALFIGPEGGFSPKDIEIFEKYNIYGFELGQNTLRAETASIVSSSLFLI
jgi:16S rRNA (uracil1498-N3)-methyltransferase